MRVSSPKVCILLVFLSSSCSGKVIPSVVRTLGIFVYSARSASIDKWKSSLLLFILSLLAVFFPDIHRV